MTLWGATMSSGLVISINCVLPEAIIYLQTPSCGKTFTPHMLHVNKRQHGNDTFVSLLNRLRTGHLTNTDMQTLSSRISYKHPSVDTVGILHIFPTIKEVDIYNDHMQLNTNPQFHIHYATHAFSSFDATPGYDVPPALIPTDDRNADGLPAQLNVSVNTRVMLLRNLYTEEGLVNGAMGVVCSLNFTDKTLKTIHV